MEYEAKTRRYQYASHVHVSKRNSYPLYPLHLSDAPLGHYLRHHGVQAEGLPNDHPHSEPLCAYPVE